MAKLSEGEIRTYASLAGFTGDDLNIAVAVALAESGGNPKAHNATPPDDSYGLWQINMLGSMGPERRKKFGISSNDRLYDPATNARAAYVIWKGSGWKAWTTYTSGKYKEHLSGGDDTSDPGDSSSNDYGVAGITGIPQAVVSAANAVSVSIFKGFANIGAVLLAIALLVSGLVILARKPAMEIVKKVAKK